MAGFVSTRGTEFLDSHGHPFLVHGFNAYFLMAISVDAQSRPMATALLQQAALAGLTVGRTWAFHDGPSYHALQPAPGVYDESVFRALDFILSEACRIGLQLILSFCNNWHDYGGKAQYVQWGRDIGLCLDSEDSFFTDPTLKQFYKDHVKMVITRMNTVTGVAYKDDPTIFSWELMNEPRCESDPSGNALQAWIEEMAAYVKSIDSNHILQVGLEGFYGPSTPNRLSENPIGLQGTDFIRNHQVSGIDYASLHAYPDSWIGSEAGIERHVQFIQNWVQVHALDCAGERLRMPLLLAEFGHSDRNAGYNASHRESLMAATYESVYGNEKVAAVGGALVWQLFPEGMEEWSDGHQILLCREEDSATHIISEYSWKVAQLNMSKREHN